ncbi:hypothetical protein E2C01_008749 [Portunus trituberculatus]|uniref:Uncharacterized protein n=1 Tax=Portunus trituberculatus TaxID=210409 RepID=A0A5B7D4M1_PORTR|nr:hypothetical protein [Portunus trituberculatus]
MNMETCHYTEGTKQCRPIGFLQLPLCYYRASISDAA